MVSILENLYKHIEKSSTKIKKHRFDPPFIKEIDSYHMLSDYKGVDDHFVGKDIKIHKGSFSLKLFMSMFSRMEKRLLYSLFLSSLSLQS